MSLGSQVWTMVSDTPSLSMPLITLLARAASCMSRRICSMRSAWDSSSRPWR